MSNDNKTLADVQPGGRVRLGNQAERAHFEAWVKNHVSSLARAADGDYASNFTHALWSAWQAALSAQPSPGGQGDAPEIEQIRTLVSSILSTVSLGHQKGPYAYAGEDFGRYLAEATRDCRAILRALSDLAARQPVGQIDEAAVLRRAAAVLDMWEGDSNQTGYMGDFKDAQAILEVLAQNAAPPAQAVDLGKYRHALLRASGWARRSDVTSHAEDAGLLRELLALIDSQAVGK